jgi:hypothetical protein
VVLLKIQGLWDVTLCCSANISQHSEGTIVLQNVGTYWDLFAKPDSVTSQSALTLRPTTSTSNLETKYIITCLGVSILSSNMSFQCSLIQRAQDPAALIYVRSEFLTVVLLKIQGLWAVTRCCSANISQHFEGTTVLQNVGTYLPNETVSHPRAP